MINNNFVFEIKLSLIVYYQLQTEKKLEELVSKANYAKGIALLLECIQGASAFKQFTCIAALSVKLQDALVMTEEQLDIVLSNVCIISNNILIIVYN